MSKSVKPNQVMGYLNELFSAFDALVDTYGVYKVWWTCRQAGRQVGRQAGGQACRLAGVQAGRCVGRQACKQAGMLACR